MNNLSPSISDYYLKNIYSLITEDSTQIENQIKNISEEKISLSTNPSKITIPNLPKSKTINKINIFSRPITLKKINKTLLTERSIKSHSREKKKILKIQEKDVKNLSLWEKENINYKNDKYNKLFSDLKKIYTREKSLDKLKELEDISSIMNSSKSTNSILINKTLKNSTLSKFYLKNKQEEGTILMNSISKTRTRFNFALFDKKNKEDLSLLNVDIEALDSMKEENLEKTKDLQNESQNKYYRKLINFKTQQESNMREEIIKIANKILEKKEEKEKIKQELEELYENKRIIDENFFDQRNNLKTQILKLDELYNFSLKKILKNGKNDDNKDTIYKNMSSKAAKWNNLENKISFLEKENKINFKEFENKKNELNKKLHLLNDELEYLKFVYHNIIQNQRNYYFNILKNGYDVRYEGLVWCVRHLIEMDTNLEYFHFPKFLNNEQIDYLISQAKSYLMENLLTLTLRILKKKQSKKREQEKQKEYKKLQTYVNLRQSAKERKKILGKSNHKLLLKKNKENIRNRILDSYNHIYNKYKDSFQNSHINYENDDEQVKKIIIEIRESILSKGYYINNEKENLILKFFEQQPKNRIILKVILELREQIKNIQKKRNEEKKKMIEKIKEMEQNKDRYANTKMSVEFDLIFSALFGSSITLI